MILVSGQDDSGVWPRPYGNRETRLTMDEITACLPGLSPVENKELVRFDRRLSSDGGVEIEKRLGLAARLPVACPNPASTTHSYADMIERLRIRGLRRPRRAALRSGVQAACGRLPESGRDLMSQPTLSRSWRELARMGLTMIDLFCDSFERVPQRIVLDIDDTDASDGGVQLALRDAHYDELRSAHRHLRRGDRLAGAVRCCVRASGHPVKEHHPLIRRHDRGAHVRHRLRIRGLRRPRRAALRSGVQAGLWCLPESGRDLMSQPTLSRLRTPHHGANWRAWG